jgi:hypothetical protein
VQTSVGELTPIVLTATEPRGHRGDPPPRQLAVWLDPLPLGWANPLEFAVAEWPEREEVTHSPLRLAGAPGVLVKFLGTASAGDAFEDEMPKMFAGGVLSAATILPSRRGLKVQLTIYGEPDSEDAELLQRVVSSLKISGEPAALATPANSQIAIPSVGLGASQPIQIAAPDGFALIEPTDPLQTARTLRWTGAGAADGAAGAATNDWRSIRMVPAFLPPREPASTGAGAIETIATMMWLADPGLAEAAKIREESPGRWRIERPDTFGVVPARGQVIADPGSGMALIVTFHGGSDEAWIDPAWQQLVSSVAFPNADEAIRAQMTAGEAEAKRIATAGATSLLGPDRAEEWWLLELPNPDRSLGWAHSLPSATGGKHLTRLHLPGVAVTQSDFDFQGAANLSTSRTLLVHSSSADVTASSMQRSLSRRFSRELPLLGALTAGVNAGPGEMQRVMDVTARLRGGKLDLGVKPAQGEATAVAIAVPPNFVPGGWLHSLLIANKLSRAPMALRTDVLPGDVTVRPTSLLGVFIRPGEGGSASGEVESPAPAGSTALLVEIAGSGMLMRCTFRPDGSLDSIDRPCGVRQVRSDATEIALQFARDARMKP